MQFPFGRYKDKTIEEIGATYDGWMYLTWFVANDADPNNESNLFYDNEELVEGAKDFLSANEKPVLSWEDKLAFTLRFGKHKGDSLGEIIKTWQGRSYLSYLTTWDNFAERQLVQDVVGQLDRMPPAVLDVGEAESRLMPFGKHKGKSLLEMRKDEEPLKYLQYLARKLPKSKKMQNQVLAMEIAHCLNVPL